MAKVQALITFFVTTLVASISLASSSVVEGFVRKEGDQFRIIEMESQKSFTLKVANEQSLNALNKLNNFDYISGFGDFVSEDLILLDSVEYVGLRRLLGLWKAPDGLVNFLDYSNLSIYFENHKDEVSHLKFNYAIAPSQGDHWKVFLTNKQSVVLGSLSLRRGKADIEIYDPNSGEIAVTIKLTKVQRD